MISKRAKHWLRRATTITLVVIVLGIGAATWYQSEQIENDLLHVVPRQLEYDLEVLAAGRGLVTLPAGPGTLASGRWGLEWESGYAALGEIVSTAPGTVTRELLEVSGNLVAGTRVALDRFAFENGPSTRGLEFEDVIVEGPLGNYPAWFTTGTNDTWVVLVHGRGSYRSEVLRLLPALAGAGYPTLTITYRNDLPAPESPNRHYGLGESEWPDLEAAVRYALLEGARDVVLVGYEVGAGITATFLHESNLAERALGVVLDSPLLVPALRVDEAARAYDVPGFIVGWSKGLATLRFGIDWRGLDQVRRAEDFTVPILVLYGGGEPEDSLAAASAFAAARPGLVDLVRIPGAGPGEAWNFDAATTPLRPEAREAMAPYLDAAFGNPSGIHGVARKAKLALEDARERAAALLGANHPLEIVFTGGGTESDNLGVAGPVLAAGPGAGIVTTAVEHEAVLETARFLERLGHPLSVIGVDAAGRVDPGTVAAAVDAETAVVSVMAANNETGVKQPVAEIASRVADLPGAVGVHTDAVQHFVSEAVRVDEWGVDLLTLASHKFGGPKGVGLLYVRDGVDLEPVLHGGGQEVGRRSGTHNVAGIVGMVAAMEAAAADRERFRAEVGAARERFEARLAAGLGAAVTAGDAPRLIQHSHLRVPGVAAETLLILLDRLGLAAAAGSACHSGAVQVSPVLAAMGLSPADAAGCVRFTFGWTTRPEDGEQAAALVIEAAGGAS